MDDYSDTLDFPLEEFDRLLSLSKALVLDRYSNLNGNDIRDYVL